MEEVDLEEVISNEKDKMIPKKDTKMKNPRGIEIEIVNKGEDENQEVWKYNVPKQLEISDNVKKSIKNYYQQNNEFLSELKSAQERFSSDGENKINLEEEKDLDDRKKCSVQIAIYASFLVNIALFVFKIMALISSSSNSILASTVDSFLDLLAGSIIFVTNYFIKKKQVYLYPAGKSRIEPLGIIVFSSLMFSLSFQVLVEALRTIVDLRNFKLTANTMSIIIIASTVVLKALLFIYCQCFVSGSSSVRALAEDHRNDVLTNSFGMLGFILGSKLALKYNDPRFKVIDPVFAICLSLFIMRNWFMTGKENVMMLSGRTAPDSFLKLLTFLAWNHHSKIKYIETVRAYHLAERYLVEIDIILDKDMPLSEAHDIGESLQKNIEELDEVERCWVHLDYEIQQDGGHLDKEN